MKNKLFWLILVLAVIAIIFSLIKGPTDEKTDFKPLEIDVGEEFSYIDYKNKMYVLNYMMKDVTGDGINDMVIVVGEKKKVDDLIARNMDIVVYEPNEKKFYNLKLKSMEGEMPKLEAYDVTGDGVLDVILSANNENENLNVRVASFEKDSLKEIMKAKDNKGIIFAGQFVDGFKGNIKSNKYNKEVVFDLNDRKENYVSNGFYDESGRLLKTDGKISTTNFISIDFVQLDGCYGIQTIQRIVGFNNEDLLDEIMAIWKFENGKWLAKEAKGNVIGNILY